MSLPTLAEKMLSVLRCGPTVDHMQHWSNISTPTWSVGRAGMLAASRLDGRERLTSCAYVDGRAGWRD